MKVYKMQPIRVSIVKTEQLIKSRENMVLNTSVFSSDHIEDKYWIVF